MQQPVALWPPSPSPLVLWFFAVPTQFLCMRFGYCSRCFTSRRPPSASMRCCPCSSRSSGGGDFAVQAGFPDPVGVSVSLLLLGPAKGSRLGVHCACCCCSVACAATPALACWLCGPGNTCPWPRSHKTLMTNFCIDCGWLPVLQLCVAACCGAAGRCQPWRLHVRVTAAGRPLTLVLWAETLHLHCITSHAGARQPKASGLGVDT